MKNILITGANSYIGTSFEKYMNQYTDYHLDTLDMKSSDWINYNFNKYDVVFHVAGLAHADVGHVSDDVKKKYYKINTDLAIETAKKAKQAGVKQFIFMSSIIVYGDSVAYNKKKVITKNTKPSPANFYGDSKLKADIKLQLLNSETFKVCILRPPMIYGTNSKGNYQLLSKLVKKIPVFPDIENERSMLYIENLCIYIKYCIDMLLTDIQFPQNNEYVSTSQMVKEIARESNKRIYFTKLLNPLVYIGSKMPGAISGMINKAFGNLTYEKQKNECTFISFEKSIKQTETQNK